MTYNCEYEQRTSNIYFSILWDLETLGRPNWESTQLTPIGKGPLNGPYKVWLMPWYFCSSCNSIFSYNKTIYNANSPMISVLRSGPSIITTSPVDNGGTFCFLLCILCFSCKDFKYSFFHLFHALFLHFLI